MTDWRIQEIHIILQGEILPVLTLAVWRPPALWGETDACMSAPGDTSLAVTLPFV